MRAQILPDAPCRRAQTARTSCDRLPSRPTERPADSDWTCVRTTDSEGIHNLQVAAIAGLGSAVTGQSSMPLGAMWAPPGWRRASVGAGHAHPDVGAPVEPEAADRAAPDGHRVAAVGKVE